jgi:hypothetical protein
MRALILAGLTFTTFSVGRLESGADRSAMPDKRAICPKRCQAQRVDANRSRPNREREGLVVRRDGGAVRLSAGRQCEFVNGKATPVSAAAG